MFKVNTDYESSLKVARIQTTAHSRRTEREFTTRGEASSRMAGWTDLWPLLPLQHFQLALIDSNPCTLSKAESEYCVSVFLWWLFVLLCSCVLGMQGRLTQTLKQLRKVTKVKKKFQSSTKNLPPYRNFSPLYVDPNKLLQLKYGAKNMTSYSTQEKIKWQWVSTLTLAITVKYLVVQM